MSNTSDLTYDLLYTSFVATSGLAILAMLFKNENNSINCDNKFIKNTLRFFLGLSTFLAVFGLAGLVCIVKSLNSGCECYSDVHSNRSVYVYLIPISIIGLIFVSLSSLIIVKSKKADDKKCQVKGLKTNMAVIIGISSSFLIFSLIFIISLIYQKIK